MATESLFSSIEFQMSLLLFVALGGYLLASRINQSAVIGEILVGLLIGPSLLGWITYTEFIESVAHLGAIILLFVIGMEFKLKEIFNIKYGLIALVGVIVPWIGGYALSAAFGFDFASAIFIGTALTATSIAITANVLKEMNLLQSEAAKAIIGAAVIDDVLSLLALSVSEQIVAGSFSVLATAIIFGKAIAFIALGALVGLKLLSPLLERVDRSRATRKFPETTFIFALMLAFFYALIAEAIALSAIVGSFIAGMVLENVKLSHGKSHKEGAEYLHIIFASIFFVSLGILVDLHALTPQMVWFLLALCVVAVLTKVVGCFVPAKMLGLSTRDAMAVGWGMSPRGEVAMIIALIGLNSGLIDQGIYISIVLMALLTTVITPIVLRNWLYRKATLRAPSS